MVGVRRRASLVALVWLLLHVTTVGVSLVRQCCDMKSMAAESSSEDEDECCKGLAPGQMCPLHKHGSHQSSGRAPTAPVPGDGVLRGGCASTPMMLTALTLDLGLVPQVVTSLDDTTATVVPLGTTQSVDRSVLPEFPPPRA